MLRPVRIVPKTTAFLTLASLAGCGGGGGNGGAIVGPPPPPQPPTATFSQLHAFAIADGAIPIGLILADDGSSPLIADTDGNLYGAAQTGGGDPACEALGCGIVFKVDMQLP